MKKIDGDGTSQRPTLWVKEDIPDDLVDDWFNLDAFVDAASTPKQWLSDFGKHLLLACMRFDAEKKDRNCELYESPLALEWPAYTDRRKEEACDEVTADPLDIDLVLQEGSGWHYARARYNLRQMILQDIESCSDRGGYDGSAIDRFRALQSSLRKFADELDELLVLGDRWQAISATESNTPVEVISK